MGRRLVSIAVLTAVLSAVATMMTAGGALADPKTTTFTIQLSGAAEVCPTAPGACGNPGIGTATIEIDSNARTHDLADRLEDPRRPFRGPQPRPPVHQHRGMEPLVIQPQPTGDLPGDIPPQGTDGLPVRQALQHHHRAITSAGTMAAHHHGGSDRQTAQAGTAGADDRRGRRTPTPLEPDAGTSSPRPTRHRMGGVWAVCRAVCPWVPTSANYRIDNRQQDRPNHAASAHSCPRPIRHAPNTDHDQPQIAPPTGGLPPPTRALRIRATCAHRMATVACCAGAPEGPIPRPPRRRPRERNDLKTLGLGPRAAV